MEIKVKRNATPGINKCNRLNQCAIDSFIYFLLFYFLYFYSVRNRYVYMHPMLQSTIIWLMRYYLLNFIVASGKSVRFFVNIP